MTDEKKWIGDVIEGIGVGADLLRAGRELADVLGDDPETDTAISRIARIVAAACTRLQHLQLAVDSLAERCRNLETALGQAQARVSVIEKARERPAGVP